MKAPGFEPGTYGLKVRRTTDECPDSETTCDNPPEPLAQTLARETQIDPDLARVIDAWPELPEAIRRAMLALVESGRKK